MKWMIYKHTLIADCKSKGKCYVGQTCKTNPNYRWNNGKGYLNRNPNSHFARAIVKYGGVQEWFISWSHEIIEDNIPTLELANQRETYWIEYFDSVNNGYNANYGGNSKIPSKETRAKLSNKSKAMWIAKGEALRAIYSSKEHKAKLSKSIKDYYLKNPEAKERISKTRKQKISITNGIETRVINADEFEACKANNWQRGTVFIKFEILASMVEDYNGVSDLSIHELCEKYHFDDKVIRRAFIELGIPIKNKTYKVWNKVKGIKRSGSFKRKHSALMKAQREGHLWVNNGIISKSILPTEESKYLSEGWQRGRGKINSANMRHDRQKKRVLCVELDRIFDSISEASRELNISKNGIINVLKKRPHCNTAGGYHWKYVDE